MKNLLSYPTRPRAESSKSELAKISELRIQKMCDNKNFFVFLPILMKLGEVAVHMGTTISKFHQNQMKNKKVFNKDHLMEVSSIKVLLRSS